MVTPLPHHALQEPARVWFEALRTRIYATTGSHLPLFAVGLAGAVLTLPLADIMPRRAG